MTDMGERLICLVRELAASSPGFVYRKVWQKDSGAYRRGSYASSYVHSGQPSCLLGGALWHSGLIDSTFEGEVWNRTLFGRWIVERFPDLAELDDSEWRWLGEVQDRQDRKHSWSESVRLADGKVSV